MNPRFIYSAAAAEAAASATAFSDLRSGGTDSVKVNKFVPTDESSIVVAMNEFASGIDNFSNYSYIGGVPHNDTPKSLREPSAIKFIVLHETSGSETGTGFVPPYTAHFVVLGDGRIQQFNDLSEIEWHESKFNNAGIGIEFVNQDWAPGSGIKKDSDASQKLKNDDNYLWAYWGDGYNIFKIPPADRMERLNTLVTRLLRQDESGFIAVDTSWGQLVSYNDVKDVFTFQDSQVPSDPDAKSFFIFSNGIGYITPQKLGSGIVSHNSVSNLVDIGNGSKTVLDVNAHSDGSFQSLYTWLRIGKSMAQDDAFAKTKELLRNNMLTVKTSQAYEGYRYDKDAKAWVSYSPAQRWNIHIVDVSGV